MEIFTDKVVSNVSIKNSAPELLRIDNRNLFVYDPNERNFQVDARYFEYAVSKLERDSNGKFKWKDVNDRVYGYRNNTSNTYFDVPYYNRNKVRK